MHLITVSKAYSIIIINVYPLLLATPTTVLVEVGALANTDAAVDMAVVAGKVLEEEMEFAALVAALLVAALTLDYSAASFILLSEISAASAAASTRLSRSSVAASVRCSRPVCRISYSSLEAAVVKAFFSSVKYLANQKQSEM